MDWIAYIFLLAQMYLLSYKPKVLSNLFEIDKLSFVCGMVASFWLVLFGHSIGSSPMFVTNLLLFFLNFKGYIN